MPASTSGLTCVKAPRRARMRWRSLSRPPLSGSSSMWMFSWRTRTSPLSWVFMAQASFCCSAVSSSDLTCLLAARSAAFVSRARSADSSACWAAVIEPLASSMSSSLPSTAALAGTAAASNRPPHRPAVRAVTRRISKSPCSRRDNVCATPEKAGPSCGQPERPARGRSVKRGQVSQSFVTEQLQRDAFVTAAGAGTRRAAAGRKHAAEGAARHQSGCGCAARPRGAPARA